MLEVCSRTRTQAFRWRRHWMIVASTIDWPKCAHSSIRRVLSIDVRFFGTVNNKIPKNIYQIFNPTNLLNHVVLSIELMIDDDAIVSNLILTTFIRWGGKWVHLTYFSLFAIFLPKIIKIGENLKKLWQKQFCTVFLCHGVVVGVSQTLRRWTLTEGDTYIRQGGHHVGQWPTF